LGNGRFDLVRVSTTMSEVEPLFRRGLADVAVVIEPGFANDLASGTPARVLVITDASDPNTGSRMQAYARAVIASFQAELAPARDGVQIVSRTRMRLNPSLESVNLFVPGLIALLFTLVTALMTAISLSREKERGMLE